MKCHPALSDEINKATETIMRLRPPVFAFSEVMKAMTVVISYWYNMFSRFLFPIYKIKLASIYIPESYFITDHFNARRKKIYCNRLSEITYLRRCLGISILLATKRKIHLGWVIQRTFFKTWTLLLLPRNGSKNLVLFAYNKPLKNTFVSSFLRCTLSV